MNLVGDTQYYSCNNKICLRFTLVYLPTKDAHLFTLKTL